MTIATRSQEDWRRPDRGNARAALRELQAGLGKIYPVNTPLALVYGSYARGEEGPESDIDVVLIYPRAVRPGQEIDRVSIILAELNLKYQVLISVLPARRQDYRQGAGAFWQNVREEGVAIEQI